MTRSRGLCMTSPPRLLAGMPPGRPCSLLAWHLGAHRNDDGTSWTRGHTARAALYRAQGWAALVLIMLIATAVWAVTGRWPD